MLTLVCPVLVSATLWVRFDPTVTLPKSSLLGLSASCPSDRPVPLTERLGTAFAASLLTETVPLKVPAEFGVNLTLRVVLCPGPTTTGRLGAAREKYLLDIDALLTVTALVPEFVAETVIVLLLPAAMLPKLRAIVANDKSPFGGWLELPALTPWHPTSMAMLASTISAPAVGMGREQISFAPTVIFREPYPCRSIFWFLLNARTVHSSLGPPTI
jgi:hypothetical protein